MGFRKNLLAFAIISLLGTVGHFIYEWSGENILLGLFFPVNESVWEHLKLLFFPAILYSFIEYFTLKDRPDNYLSSTAIGIYCGIFTIISVFYITSGILGFNSDFINICSYYISVITFIIKKNKIINEERFSSKNARLLFLIFLIINTFIFIYWSYNPPSLGIFIP